MLLSKVESNLNEELNFVADAKFEAHEKDLEKKKRYNWINLAVFVFIGFILALILQKVFAKLSKPKYNRTSLEGVMKEKLGHYNISQTISDELLITAYDYNSQEPRFYSKYYA